MISPFIAFLVIFFSLKLTEATFNYFEPNSFLPNYARSFSALSGLPAHGLLLPGSPTPAAKPVPDEEEAHGFHLGSELESRSLTGFPDLSPLFNQPVSTYDWMNRAQGRLLRTNGVYAAPYLNLPLQHKSVPKPSQSPVLPATSLKTIQPPDDYSNPFFRPVYVRPPAPPARNQTKRDGACQCSCSQSTTTTALPAALKSANTTAAPPVDEKSKLSAAPMPVKVKLMATAAATNETLLTSIDDLVQEAFTATRTADAESKDANLVGVEAEDKNPSLDEFPDTTGEISTTGLPTSPQPVPEETSTAKTTELPVTDPTTENSTETTTIIPLNILKALNFGAGKSPNRRFNSLLDLSMRRGGRQHLDMN